MLTHQDILNVLPDNAAAYIAPIPFRPWVYAIYDRSGLWCGALAEQFRNWPLTVMACVKNPPRGMRCDDAGFLYLAEAS